MADDVDEVEDHQAVTFEVTRLTRHQTGAILATADVQISVSDVEFEVCGWLVLRKRQSVEITGPRYRDPVTGNWHAAFALPPELVEAVANEIAAGLGLSVWPAVAVA